MPEGTEAAKVPDCVGTARAPRFERSHFSHDLNKNFSKHNLNTDDRFKNQIYWVTM